MSYEVKAEIGELSKENKQGWKKKLRKISWYEKEAVYDIRAWSPEGDKMSKGITLSKEEAKKLSELLHAEFVND